MQPDVLHSILCGRIEMVEVILDGQVIGRQPALEAAGEFPMNPEPTIELPLDYLVEITDESAQPDGQEPDILVLPPPMSGKDPSTPPKTPEQGPQA
jgi:hypothetical protein